MTAQDLNQRLCALYPALDRAKTVDQVIAGDPLQPVQGVAVCWMPFSAALKEAAGFGASVVVTHEPTFYDHHEQLQHQGPSRLEAAKKRKTQLIDELGLTILRCHDVWDAMPEIGVPFEWGRFLGFKEIERSTKYMNVYRVDPRPALEWARAISARTADAGQATVEFYGDPEAMVSTIGVGTGCYSDALALYDLGADLAVTVDDIARAWIVGEYCNDEGLPLVVVNHGVSEDCAMGSLAETIRSMLPGVPVHLIRQGASYREVRAER